MSQAIMIENSPESANISTKSAFGLGQIYFVKSQIYGEDWIERAKNEFNIVIEDYEAGDVRLREIVSHAYARMGLFAWFEGDLETAVDFYRKAIEVASPFFQGYYYASIGDIYTTANRTEDAREAYSES